MVTRGGPVRQACQRSNVLLQTRNSAASSSGVIYSARTVPTRSIKASAVVSLCSATFAPPGTYRDASYIVERQANRFAFNRGPFSAIAVLQNVAMLHRYMLPLPTLPLLLLLAAKAAVPAILGLRATPD